MKKGIITVLLAICILISALPFAQVDAASAAENARLQSYEQFLAYYYQTYSLLDYLMENSDSPCRTIVNNADEDLEGALEIWRKATMDVGDLAKYSEKEIEFYEFLIFDILYQKNALDLGLKNAETAVNVLQSEILNEYAELGLDMTLLTKVTEENVDELLNKLIHFDNLKFLSGNFEALRKAMGYVADVGELSEKLYILLEMNNSSEVVHDILNQLYQKSTDSAMKEACRRVSLISTGLITEAEIIAVFSGRVVLQEAASHVMDKIWGDIVSSTSLGRALSIGKKVGKLTSNIMFGTDAVVENWYSMKQLNTFETVMKSVLKSYQSSYNSSPTYQNALLFNKAADMYMRTHSVGSEYALKYAEVAMGGGFFGWIYKNFTHKDDYEYLIGTLNSIKTNVDCAIDFVNNNTYNFYLDELEAYDSAVPAWKPTPTVVTREEVDQKTEEMPELFFRTTNQTTSTSVTYADDKLTYADYTHTDGTLKLNGNTLTIYGNLYLTGGTIDLWTGTLIVRGNVYQSGGSMLINKGRLEIGGDYRIQKRNVDEWGVVSYSGTSGVMRMQYPEDFVAVGRSFVTQSNSGNGSSGNLYSAGTMEIGGDFIQLKHSSSTVSEQNFAASGTHKVILNGAGAQTVSFQSNSSGFNYLEMDQASDVTFKDYLRVNAMHSNGTAKSVGLDLWDFGINGKSMTIVGDMSISGNVDLKLGNLNIDGDVTQTNGIVVLNKGRLTTTGDYRIQKRNVDEWGTVSYSGSSGVMRMQYAEDFVAVGGSFVTQSISGNGSSSNLFSTGTMEIGGDFIQKEHSTVASDQNFAASGTHEVILNGTGAQTVSFQSNLSGFNYLEMDQAEDVTFKNYLRVNAMHSDGYAKSVGLELLNFSINGKSLTIVGDMSISGNVDLKLGNLTVDGDVTHTDGAVVLNKGSLTTTGDYRIQSSSTDEWGVVTYSQSSGTLKMQYEEDTVTVGGSFVTQSRSSYNVYKAGTMKVGGDFVQLRHNAVGDHTSFSPSGTHKVILNGTGLQKVTFQSTSSGFNILDLHRTPTSEYRFSRVPCWKTLLDYGKAHEHDLVSDVTVPTCTKGGFTTYSCYCGHSVVSDYTDALGHNETVDAPVAPGCERTGLTEGAHCDRCGLVLTAQEEIPALGHDHQRGICIRCGDSIVTASGWSGATQWVLTQEGELIVYGQGNMKNYGWTGGQPWAAYAGQVRSVVIEQGVKQVGSGAFKDMTSLESVLLPTSLKTIGIAAFYGCTALEEIVIPEGIYTVWEYTFKNCTSLETVSLPNTLIKIDQGAFEACTALGELYLPANVNIIGGWSFKGCTALTAVDMHDAVATEIRAGAFKNCTSLTNVILPGNIRTLGDSCFYGIGAEEFVLPTTVDNIGPWCFARSQLRQVTFEGDAPAIGEGAFNKITLTAYYPAGNATWNSMNMLNYGGTITWTAK